jgi:hypothetical protein
MMKLSARLAAVCKGSLWAYRYLNRPRAIVDHVSSIRKNILSLEKALWASKSTDN